MPALLLRDSSQPTTIRRTVLKDLGYVETYPTLSDTTLRLMELANSDTASVAEAVEVVRRDSVLASRVLRTANSCLFRGRTEIEEVQQAVLRLGLQECTRLLCTVGLRSVYESYPVAVRTRCDALLRHSLFVARLAGGLARLGAVVPPSLAFTAGLLHDIGRIVLCVKCDDVAEPPAREDDETPNAERTIYGIDHCAIGYQFANRNGLPETIVRTVLNHHRPEEEHLQRTVVALVAVAERVGNHVQWKHTVADYDLMECPRFAVLSDSWGSKRTEAFRAGLPNATVQALRDTRRMLRSVA